MIGESISILAILSNLYEKTDWMQGSRQNKLTILKSQGIVN